MGESSLPSRRSPLPPNMWSGVAFATIGAFERDERPGWVKVPESAPAYGLGARWFVRCMVGCVVGRLTDGVHKVTEHEDGTITVEPSLVMHSGWHGWLRAGVFEMLDAGENPTSPTTEQRLRAALCAIVDLYRHPDSGRVVVEAGASTVDDAIIAALDALGETA